MEHLPIFLAMRGKWAAVIGGRGLAAARRAELLLRAGAHVTVFRAGLQRRIHASVSESFAFRRIARWPHEAAELDGVAVCVVATDDRAQDERARTGIATEAKGAGQCRDAARPHCDFAAALDRRPQPAGRSDLDRRRLARSSGAC